MKPSSDIIVDECGCRTNMSDKFVEYCDHHLTEMEGEHEYHEAMRQWREERGADEEWDV